MSRYEMCIPSAKNLLHSLRDIGYTFETAVADIVDNSITAQADKISIIADYQNGSPLFIIADNGIGMSVEELKDAMCIGSIDPNLNRDCNDLGRFGLGLKTATFSQAKKLTVLSKKDGLEFHGRCWDLDHISNSGKWEIEKLSQKKIDQYTSLIKTEITQGTIVVWELLDRIFESDLRKISQEELFNSAIASLREHLGLIFHRYIQGEKQLTKLKILVNNLNVEPNDPFLSEFSERAFHSYTYEGIGIEPHLLPHHSKIGRQLTTERYRKLANLTSTKLAADNSSGFMKNQGFFVYRNKRLIVFGTWFGIIPQMPSTKLLRVKLDLPNTNDFSWQIDIKKSRAKPPTNIKNELYRLLTTELTVSATKVYTQRGVIIRENSARLWNEIHSENKFHYQINFEATLIKEVLAQLSDAQRKDVEMVLKSIESSVPFDLMMSKYATHSENIIQTKIPNGELEIYAIRHWSFLNVLHTDIGNIENVFRQTEPFVFYKDFCDKFVERMKGQK